MKKLLLLGALAVASMANASVYELDPMHTNARFAIDHFGTSTNVGGFYGLTGTLNFDRNAKTGSIDISIPVTHLQTATDEFTHHIKSADMLDVIKYPSIRFTSTKFNYVDNKLSSVDGRLTMKGKTHPVTLWVEKFNCYDNPIYGTEVCGADLTTTIDRTKWGVDYLVDIGITKEMRLNIQAEALKR